MTALEPRAVVSITRLGCGVAEAIVSLIADEGAVVGRFRRALNLRSASGRLLVLHGRDLPLTPFSAELADVPDPWPPVGAPARITRGHLRVGRLKLRLPARRDAAASMILVPTTVRSEAASILEPMAARSTFGRWWCVSEADGDPHTSWATRPARVALRRLVHAVQRSDRAGAVGAGLSLLGLGPGLTPSGDDALVGFLGAWRWLSPRPLDGDAPPTLDDDIRRAVLGAIVERAPSATTPISAEFLHHRCADRVSEPLLHLFAALASGSRHEILDSAERIAAWGATSGVDTLAGVHSLLRASGRAPLQMARVQHRVSS